MAAQRNPGRALRYAGGSARGLLIHHHRGRYQDWIPGYKPAFNFQMTLVDAVARWLALNPAWLGRQPGLQTATALREAAQIWIAVTIYARLDDWKRGRR